MVDRVPSKADFWRPPLWKWVLVLSLLIAAFFLFKLPFRIHTVDAPPAKIVLLPFSTAIPAWDGSSPYLVLTPEVQSNSKARFKFAIRFDKLTLWHDAPVNEFEVDLHSGRFVLRQTDVFISDVMPVSLTRTYRVWDGNSRAFGAGANHPYDICPTGTRFPYTYMDLNLEDGRQVHFPRISVGTGYADAVFRHGSTNSEFYDARISWNGDGWTLNLVDGHTLIFPEAYHARSFAQGAPLEMRDGRGNRTQLKRDRVRNLETLMSPSGHTVTFRYDSDNRIIEAGDDSGNIRKYSYDPSGHLETVSDGRLTLYRFGYEDLLRASGYDPYLMTTIWDGNGKVLLQNVYGDHARVTEQRTADGQVYRYDYLFGKKHDVVETTVTLPTGETKRYFFQNGIPSSQK